MTQQILRVVLCLAFMLPLGCMMALPSNISDYEKSRMMAMAVWVDEYDEISKQCRELTLEYIVIEASEIPECGQVELPKGWMFNGCVYHEDKQIHVRTYQGVRGKTKRECIALHEYLHVIVDCEWGQEADGSEHLVESLWKKHTGKESLEYIGCSLL